MTEASLLRLGEYNRLGTKTFWLFFYKKMTTAVVFLIIAFFISIARTASSIPVEVQPFMGLAGVICFVIFFIALVIALLVSWIVYRNYEFCLTDDAFKMREGVFTEREIAIPYRQIQNVSIERNMNEQILGLSRIIISTAARDDEKTLHDESRGILPALDKKLALELQTELLKRADVQRFAQTQMRV